MADEDEDFAALFAASEATAGTQRRIRAGELVKGRVVEIGSTTAFVAIGAKADAVIDLAEFRDAESDAPRLAVGDEIEATVTDDGDQSGTIVLAKRFGHGGHVPNALAQAHAHGLPIEGVVTGQNKGGFDVQIAGVRAFCPASQMDLRRGDPAAYVGQRFAFAVTKVESHGRNVVVSRRELLEQETAAQAARTLETLRVGAVVPGTIVSLRDFGAFVDLGGVEGMIHVSELGHARAKHPSDVVQVGQRIEAQVVKLEPGAGPGGRPRIGLSLRALAPDPWRTVAERFPVGSVVHGVVRRLEQFGAFVELAPGVEGLVHVSQMALDRRIAHARQGAEVGQEVDVTVTTVDLERKRLGLSMTAGARHARDAAEQAEQRETANLMTESNRPRGFGTLGDLLQRPKPR